MGKELQPSWLRDVFTLRARKGIDARDRLLLEGMRANHAALAAGVPFERVLYTPEFFSDSACTELLALAERGGVPSHRLEPHVFSRISYKAEGLVGVVRFTARSLDEVLRSPLVVVLDALSDPGNIGAVVRTANAWRAAVVVVDDAGKLYHPKSLRASLGALFDTPICSAGRSEVVGHVAGLGRPVVAVTPGGEPSLAALPFGEPMVLVFGNERRGVHPRWLEVATSRVAIPMHGIVDSLNVATAAAIMLWEAFRQR